MMLPLLKCVQTALLMLRVWSIFSGTFQALIQFADAMSAYNAKTVSILRDLQSQLHYGYAETLNVHSVKKC